MSGDALRRLQELREMGHALGQAVGQGGSELVPPAGNCPKAVGQGLSQKSAKNGTCPTVPPPCARDGGTSPDCIPESGTSFGTNVGTSGLPDDLKAGLLKLRSMPAPRITRPSAWGDIVADALWLASEGWAAQALNLGWRPIDLFGCASESVFHDNLDGLAVWLAGRRHGLFDVNERRFLISIGGHRAQYSPRSMDGACFLWELGRGRGRNA